MSLRYGKASPKPTVLRRLFGLTPAHFKDIMTFLRPFWRQRVLEKYKCLGLILKLGLKIILLILLAYDRSYIPREFVGFLFGINSSRGCRLMRRLEARLTKIMPIEKTRALTQKEVEELLIDATEQPTWRPRRKRKQALFWQKKPHTIKTEIQMNAQGRIRRFSKSHPGLVHEFTVCKQEATATRGARAYADSGYQGRQDLHIKTELPHKKFKNKGLDVLEKKYHRALSRF